MRKLSFLLLAFSCVFASQAQPHSWLVYGTGMYDNNTYDLGGGISNTATSWSINPGIGYQFDKHFTAGVQGSYSNTTNSSPGFVPLTIPIGPELYPFYNNYGLPEGATNWSAGLFGRYTQWYGNIFFVYGQLNVSYMGGSLDYSNNTILNATTGAYQSTWSSTGFMGMLYPGIGVNIYKGLALTFDFGGIAYTSISQDNPGGGQLMSSHFNVNFAQQINVGISKNFGMMHMHMHHKHAAEPGTELRRHRRDKDDDDDDAPPPSKKK